MEPENSSLTFRWLWQSFRQSLAPLIVTLVIFVPVIIAGYRVHVDPAVDSRQAVQNTLYKECSDWVYTLPQPSDLLSRTWNVSGNTVNVLCTYTDPEGFMKARWFTQELNFQARPEAERK